MNSPLIKRLGMTVEPGIIGLLLFFPLGVVLIPSLDKLTNAASYLIVPFLVIRRWKQCIYTITKDASLLLLLVTAVASIFWSAAPTFTITEIKPLLRSTFLGIYLATRYKIEDLVRIFVWLFGIGIVIGLVGYLSSSLRGFLSYKNSVATVAAIGAMLLLLTAINRPRHRWVALAGFGMAVAVILLSLSKSGLSVFVILLILWPLYSLAKQHYKLQVVLLIVTILLGSILAVLILNNLETIVVDKLGKNLEFNGRTPIWNLILEKGLERPWFGYGYVGFWTSDAGLFVVYHSWASEGEGDTTSRFNSHNGFLDLFVQLGGVGFFLYILNLLTVLSRTIFLFFSTKKAEFFGMFQIVLSFVFFSLSDSVNGMILTPSPFWIIYVSLSLSTCLYYKDYLSHRCKTNNN